ncbi:Citrinin biosynthesis transcriptional activator ctnR [Hyphodiscus hymeniophilus]|uniref:Citrinin biosynthesis transcriptional activator ctnR n=1 Tax=Hyphodiscus hymeniophilus TaxID=353542 RepID=A0A9P6VLL0_9HELO|nr:Citrinin biosynthesis transcriptional activator ctnR [Hyphodiscus hymeniophilus]
MSSASNTPPEEYFNDLSRPTGNNGRNKRQRSPTGETYRNADAASGGDANAPKPKRIACIICRKRKLKCDGSKPSCSTCTRLGHSCAYDEVRRKSGPKRGYVKALEERLKQVETLLKTQDPPATTPESAPTSFGSATSGIGLRTVPAADFSIPTPSMGIVNDERWRFNGESPQPPLDDMSFPTDINMGMGLDDSTFTWEMIGLGLEEPLPPQESIDELHQIYFDKIHPSVPMMHKYRYLAAMNLAPNQRPPVALRYAMWTLAASVTEKFMDLKDHFYQRARKYMEGDYMKGHGEHMISIAHAQAHVLLASYEFKMMYFPRAWMSTGSAIRLCQMMGLHRLDGAGLDVKQCLPPPRDWTEREERRRTFWMAFAEDRYASIGTGWPMTIDERDILTDLPGSDEAFEMSKPERTLSLAESMSPSGASKLSAFGGIVLMACLFGRNLIHLHRPDADDRDNDLNGEFWKRHRNMDNILLNTSLSMPSHLKLPNGLSNANIVFTNMNIHTSTICLHQAAIYKAEKNRLPASISAESKVRCITAANEIASIMRMISHMDLSSMNPFISFCLYVAARVFVQYLKSRPDDSQSGDSLRFLLSAMNALKRKNPLTESFLVQLDVDLEGLGMRNPKFKGIFAYSDDNLGLSTAKMPMMGGASRSNVHRQECSFLLKNDGPNPMDDNNTVNADGANTLRRESDPTSGSSDQPNWVPLPDHTNMDNGEVHRTLQGLALGNIPTATYGTGELSGGGYVNSESSNANDSSFSPNTGNSDSNRPTPNSTTPSESRANLKHSQRSGGASYETSPASSHNARVPVAADSRSMSAFFSGQPDYSTIPSTGMTPDNNAFTMPDTPGREFQVPPGWEMSGGTTGLTPVGQGVFNQLMGLGPMDAMDLGGWDEGN